MRLKNILIVVDDIELSKKFYAELFGLKGKTDFGGNVMLTEGLVLQERAGWEEVTGAKACMGNHDAELYFEEADMDSFLEKLQKTDLQIIYLNECAVDGNGQRVLRLYDPDKHIIEVKEAPKLGWQEV